MPHCNLMRPPLLPSPASRLPVASWRLLVPRRSSAWGAPLAPGWQAGAASRPGRPRCAAPAVALHNSSAPPPSWRSPEFNPPGSPAESAQASAPVGPPAAAAARRGTRSARGRRRRNSPVELERAAAAPRAAKPRSSSPRARASSARAKGPSPAGQRQNRTFEERYRELTLYYLEHGHCLVPVNEPPGLGGWVAYQRRLWKSGALPLDHYHALAALGFQFDAFDARWAARFRQLAAFHSRYGHATVPADPRVEAEWPGLRQWTLVQRQLWKRGLLADDRARRLSGLGFVWQPGEARWEERFAELVAFKQEHGHCNVPKGWPRNQGLATWVEKLRTRWRARQGVRPLSHSREARLRELGFEFEPQERCWEERFRQLQRLLQQRGHLGGPFPAGGEWAGLAEWVAHQRLRQREGRLHPDRKEALDRLGFEWDAEQAAWAGKLRALDSLLTRLGPRMALALLDGSSPARQPAGAIAGPPSTSSRSAQVAAAAATSARRDTAVAAAEGVAAGVLLGEVGDASEVAGGAAEPAGQVGAARQLQELVRWYQAARRQAAAGELSAERREQLAARGLRLPAPGAGAD